MKISIDVRCLMAGRRTGVEEYTLNLLLTLFKTDNKNEYVLFFNSWKEPAFDFSVFSKFKNVRIKRLGVPNKILNALFWYFGWPHIDKICGNTDIIFLPNITFFGASRSAKIILTVHDLSFELYGHTFSLKRKLWHFFINARKLCLRADKIISVSDSTKNDIVNLYKIKPDKIKTIYSGINDMFGSISRNDMQLIKIKEKYKLPFSFILYLGTIEPRKNIAGLIMAFNQLLNEAETTLNQVSNDSPETINAKQIIKYNLVIAGSPGWKQHKILREISHSPHKNKIRLIDFIPEEEKKYLYGLATLFIYPSLFEGFGFPPLEAMKCGLPVVISNNSSLSEIVGNSALLIEPDKPDEIKMAIREMILDKNLRAIYIERGTEQTKLYHWTSTALSFLDIVQKML